MLWQTWSLCNGAERIVDLRERQHWRMLKVHSGQTYGGSAAHAFTLNLNTARRQRNSDIHSEQKFSIYLSYWPSHRLEMKSVASFICMLLQINRHNLSCNLQHPDCRHSLHVKKTTVNPENFSQSERKESGRVPSPYFVSLTVRRCDRCWGISIASQVPVVGKHPMSNRSTRSS